MSTHDVSQDIKEASDTTNTEENNCLFVYGFTLYYDDDGHSASNNLGFKFL